MDREMAQNPSKSRGTGANVIKPVGDADPDMKDSGAQIVDAEADKSGREARSASSASAASKANPPHAAAQPGASRGPKSGMQVSPQTGGRGPGGEQPRGAPLRRAPIAASRGRVPANDDMPSIGGLVYALHQRPSRSPFILAGIMSAVWLGLGLLVGWSVMQKHGAEMQTMVDVLANPLIIGTFAGVVVPIAMFWFLAFLIWRAQELRLMSSAMTEVAVRLAEPDKMAEQSVASLGQTVRRQVAAMNDAISRALGRAGELEALVHNEVTALERSYSENDHRIRSLINELASEREALANNSSRVSEALRGIGGEVRREIEAASEVATQSLSTASSNLSDTLASRAQKITAAVTAAGTAVDEKLAERGALVNEQLARHSAKAVDNMHQQSLQVTSAIQQASDRASAAISAKSNSLVHSVITMSERVAQEIPALLDRLGGEQKRLNSIITDAASNLTALETALTEKTAALDSTLNDRTKMLQTVLSDHSRTIDTSIAERTQALEAILGQRARDLQTALGSGTERIEASIIERAKVLESALSRQSGSIRKTLEQHASNMDQSLAHQSAIIERSVSQSSQSIERAVEELAERTTVSSHALEAQAETLRQMSGGLLNQIHGLTKRFEEQGSVIMKSAKALEVSNTRVDSMMETRQAQLGKLIQSISSRAMELDKMMHSYSGMLEDALTRAESRARNVTQLLANDSTEKSQLAVREIEKLRSQTQAQTYEAIEELKLRFGALSDQIGEQLNNLTSRFSETSQSVRDSTRRASLELESTSSELRRQAKAIPETTRESASAMRKALQDQLAALDSLTDLAGRHRHSGSIGRPEARRMAITNEPAARQARPQQGRPQPLPSSPPRQERSRQDMRQDVRQDARQDARQNMRQDTRPAEPVRRERSSFAAPQRPRHAPAQDDIFAWQQDDTRSASRGAYKLPWDDDAEPGIGEEDFSAAGAGLVGRLDANPSSLDASISDASAAQDSNPFDVGSSAVAGQSGQWSLGDLLARASDPNDDMLGSDETQSYGRPPEFATEGAGQNRPKETKRPAGPVEFNMSDIAAASDKDTVARFWKRYNRGDRSAINRSVYTRQGQSTFDNVQLRYQTDDTFRHIADRYMADFEKVLKDASNDSEKLQNYLVSDTGRIYLMLAHASGRLG
jgi:hypothetical protein